MKNYFKIKTLILTAIFFVGLFGLARSASAAGPVILYTDVISGPNSGTNDGPGGAYLTLFGRNFGETRGDSTVAIGGGEVGAYKYWSDERVSVQLGPNCATGNIVLHTPEGSATGSDQFTVRFGDMYFVSVSGVDATGTVNDISHPYHDPEFVESLASFGAGDFIVVRGGTYGLDDGTYQMDSSRWLYPQKSGSEGNPITFYGYPETDGSFPNLQIDNPGQMIWRNYSTLSDWVIANFEIAQTVCDDDLSAAFMGVGAAATYCVDGQLPTHTFSRGRFVNFDVHGGCGSKVWGANGFSVGRADNVKIYGLTVRDRADGGEATDHALYLSACQNDIDVGWIKLTGQANSRAILQVHQDAYDCWGLQCFDDIYIHDSEISNSDGQALMLDGGIADVWVYNNKIVHTKSSIQGDVVDFRLRSGVANVRFYNNTIYAEDGYPLDFGPVTGENDVATFDIRNNIIMTDSASSYYRYKDTVDYPERYAISSSNNIWHGSVAGSPPAWDEPWAHQIADPLFLNPAENNFHLQSGSPAIGAGIQQNATFTRDFDGLVRGASWDIGAYEYVLANDDTTAPDNPTNLVVL